MYIYIYLLIYTYTPMYTCLQGGWGDLVPPESGQVEHVPTERASLIKEAKRPESDIWVLNAGFVSEKSSFVFLKNPLNAKDAGIMMRAKCPHLLHLKFFQKHKTRFFRYESRSKNPDIGFSAFCLFIRELAQCAQGRAAAKIQPRSDRDRAKLAHI